MFAQLGCSSGKLYFADFLRLMTQGRPSHLHGVSSSSVGDSRPRSAERARSSPLHKRSSFSFGGKSRVDSELRYRAAYQTAKLPLESSYMEAVEGLKRASRRTSFEGSLNSSVRSKTASPLIKSTPNDSPMSSRSAASPRSAPQSPVCRQEGSSYAPDHLGALEMNEIWLS